MPTKEFDARSGLRALKDVENYDEDVVGFYE